MVKRIIAIVMLAFILISLALPVQLQNKELKDEVYTISQCNQVAGVYAICDETPYGKNVGMNGTSLKKSDYELICRTVYCEAGNQDIHTQIMVALTILNRVASDKFPNTVKGVVYQKNAYAVTTWNNFEQYKWTKQVEKAVKKALKDNKHPNDMFYFRTKYYHKFGKPYMKSNDLWFSTQD